MNKETLEENCCTPIGQIKRYVDCKGCDRKPKQETLEEVAERLCPNKQVEYDMFIEGAKWQQERSYSEEDMRKAIQETITLMRYKATEFREHENTIIEQFKKK
jgi:hypothetical protein